MPIINSIATGKIVKKEHYFDHLRLALPKIQILLNQDSENIANGIYPMQVLIPENPVTHFVRIPLLYIDAFRAGYQSKGKQAKKFDKNLDSLLNEYPEYYPERLISYDIL